MSWLLDSPQFHHFYNFIFLFLLFYVLMKLFVQNKFQKKTFWVENEVLLRINELIFFHLHIILTTYLLHLFIKLHIIHWIKIKIIQIINSSLIISKIYQLKSSLRLCFTNQFFFVSNYPSSLSHFSFNS